MDKFYNQQPAQYGNNFNVNDINQIRELVERLSPEDRKEISTMLRSCAAESMVIRGSETLIFIF
jgi:hypothetical protein